MSRNTPNRMLAQAPEMSGASSTVRPSSTRGAAYVPPGARPETALATIRSLLREGEHRAARRVAAEAVTRFPGHEEIRNAARVLGDGTATVRPGHEPSREEELAWLRNPPESVRGKWVALVGSEMVGADESLADLIQVLDTKSFPKRPLVHRVD